LNSCIVHTLGALTANSRSSCVCKWMARVPLGQAMKSTTAGSSRHVRRRS
jgi:hypothetical protein